MGDILRMLFNCVQVVFDTLDSAVIITIADVGITLGDVLWGFFILSMLFTFFLVPRAGSGFGGVGNVLTYMRDDFNRENARERQKQNEFNREQNAIKRQNESMARAKAREAEQNRRNSYEYYAERRKRNESFYARYNKENGISPKKKGDK